MKCLDLKSCCGRKGCIVILLISVIFAACISVAVTLAITLVGDPVRFEAKDLEWWKKTVVYQVYPRSFQDSDGDGIGDLKGITSRLDHFGYLGVRAIWLSPIYKSPMVDMGYDISNFTEVDPLFGNMQDFEELVSEAHKRGIRVIMDFVPNHTSHNHTWFLKSLDHDTKYGNYYIWSYGKRYSNGTLGPPNNWRSEFGGSSWEKNNCRFYYHAFLKEQPDLNYRNPDVQEEMKDVLRFWLNRGVDGFRVDAVQYLFEVQNTSLNEPNRSRPYTANLPEIFPVLKSWVEVLREFEKKDGRKRFMVVEAYSTMNDSDRRRQYYATGAMPFNFDLVFMNRTWDGLLVSELVRRGIVELPADAWPNFVIGNHDNPRVSEHMTPQFVNAMNMLLLTLPGTPTTYYGEEIGMKNVEYTYNETQDTAGKRAGPNHYKEYSRDPERSPMQWNDTFQAGFSTSSHLWLHVDSNYTYRNVEVQKQARGDSNILIYRNLVKLRWQPSFQNKDILFSVANKNVFSYVREAEGRPRYLIAINFGKGVSTDNYSGKPMVSDHGVVVINTGNFESNQYAVDETIDLKHVTLEPGQGIVVRRL